MEKLKILLAEDHKVVREGTRKLLESQPDFDVVGEASDGLEAVELAKKIHPEIIIMDVSMPRLNGIEATKQIKALYPDIAVLVLTGYDDPLSIRALVKAGATGYILKHEDLSLALPQAVRALVRGERFYSPAVLQVLLAQEWAGPSTLTAQEVQVVRLVAQGLQNNRIGEALGVSEKRIRNILTGVYEKLAVHEGGEVHPRVAVVNQARALGLLVEK